MCNELPSSTASNTDSLCCDDPNVVQVPERRFKLPGATHRETTGVCLNCRADHEPADRSERRGEWKARHELSEVSVDSDGYDCCDDPDVFELRSSNGDMRRKCVSCHKLLAESLLGGELEWETRSEDPESSE